MTMLTCRYVRWEAQGAAKGREAYWSSPGRREGCCRQVSGTSSYFDGEVHGIEVIFSGQICVFFAWFNIWMLVDCYPPTLNVLLSSDMSIWQWCINILRVSCMVASSDDIDVSAVVCLGYPLKVPILPLSSWSAHCFLVALYLNIIVYWVLLNWCPDKKWVSISFVALIRTDDGCCVI